MVCLFVDCLLSHLWYVDSHMTDMSNYGSVSDSTKHYHAGDCSGLHLLIM